MRSLEEPNSTLVFYWVSGASPLIHSGRIYFQGLFIIFRRIYVQ